MLILKDDEKWTDPTPSKMGVSEGSESILLNCINLMSVEQYPTNSSSNRPVGVKKAKEKRKAVEFSSDFDDIILTNIKKMQENRELVRENMYQLMQIKFENYKR